MPFLFAKSQARRALRIGLPIFVAQLSQIGMNFADTIMSGHYSAEAMAAVAVGCSIWQPASLLAIGCLLALPGMSATVIVDFAELYERREVPLLIPVEAVFSPDNSAPDSQVVWVAAADAEGVLWVRQRPVKVGQISGDGIQVLEGLQAGEQVVAAGGRELSEGAAVKPWVRERGL